jgi:virginiamycin B lyase
MLKRLKGLRVVLFAAGAAMLLVSVAQAAPIGTLKQFRVPTANGEPKGITQGSDGNFWFTEGHISDRGIDHHIGRITPGGAITEFLVCQFCYPNDIVQGPDGILYFTKSGPGLGRITTDGTVLPDVVPTNTLANGNGVAARGNDIYFAAFNTNSIWRFNAAGTGTFTEFRIPTPSAVPHDVAVAADGTVWFSEFGADQLGKLDPVSGAITEISLWGPVRTARVGSPSPPTARCGSRGASRIPSASLIRRRTP